MRAVYLILAFLPAVAWAHGPAAGFQCDDMSIFDYSTAMCMPRAMADMPMGMLMIHGNVFAVDDRTEGPRGRNAFVIPNMEMLDVGHTLGGRHYLNLEIMTTVEKWTFPQRGYPELLQIGEEDQNHQPFIDAQHPHSSPVMGLTLSDTISLGDDKDYVKVFAAPRGASTDGPVPFMHRSTGQAVNPDSPLGHHVGQDVGHISSTVLGASLGLGATCLEGSVFNGREPQPERVDLPLYVPNSWALRAVQVFSPDVALMASVAEVANPEPSVTRLWRISGSLYSGWDFVGRRLDNTLIYGQLNGLLTSAPLHSFADEAALRVASRAYWTRLEVLERTGAELEIPNGAEAPQWVTAMTLGFTQALWRQEGMALNIGVSVTRDFLPENLRAAYNGDPWTEKVFVQITAFRMSTWTVQN